MYGIFGLAIAVGNIVSADRSHAIEEIWRLMLDKQLRGRIYQTGIVSEDRPVVLATTPNRVLGIADGKLDTLFLLNREGNFGETAILPSPVITGNLQQARIGVLVHKHHDINSFRLVDLNGKTLFELKGAVAFHYRLAPDGISLVGIDSGGQHAIAGADRFDYNFVDVIGPEIFRERQIRSPDPQPNDSAYAPDGRAFLTNSATEGLSSYNTEDLSLLWNIPKAVNFFASANGAITHSVVSDANIRNVAQFFQTGKLQWTLKLQDFGVKENVRNLAISPNGKIIIVSSASLLLILGPESAKPLGFFDVGPELTINSVAVNDHGFVAIGAQQADLQGVEKASGAVFLLNINGKILLSRGTVHEQTNAWIPMVQFDATGQFLLIRTLELLSLFLIESGQ
jgi:hypothetical protein